MILLFYGCRVPSILLLIWNYKMLRIIWSAQEQDGLQITVLCSIAGIPPFLLDATGTLSFVDYENMTEKKLLKMIEIYRLVVVFPLLSVLVAFLAFENEDRTVDSYPIFLYCLGVLLIHLINERIERRRFLDSTASVADRAL